MKKTTLVCCTLFFALSVAAQEVISAQGESFSNNNVSIDSSIGEVVTHTGTNGTHDLTQGFHQSNWNLVNVEDYVVDYEASIFPNPTANLLNIKASAHEDVVYILHDARGRVVMQDELSSELTSLQVGELAAGNYTLTLTNQSQKLKSFTLIKTH